MCGSAFYLVLLCYVTLLAIRSRRSSVLFRLFSSPFPEICVQIVFLGHGVSQLF